MATESRRDVELGLSVKTSGGDGVRKLAGEVDALAKSGSDAAPEFERLSSELNKIGAQTDAVAGLGRINDALAATEANLKDARTNVERLGDAFKTQEATTIAFREAQKTAAATVAQTSQQLQAAKAALNSHKAELVDGEKATAAFKEATRLLQGNVAQLENQLKADDSLVAKKAQINAVEKALRDATRAFDGAKGDVAGLSAALGQQAEQAGRAIAAINSLGVEATDLASAQSAVSASFAKASAAVIVSVEAQARAETQAKELTRAQALLNAELELQGVAARQGAAALDAANAKRSAQFRDAAKLLEAELQLERELASERVALQNRTLANEKAVIAARTDALRRSAAEASQALENAFSSTGVRSAAAIRAEIDRIQQGLLLVARDAKTTAGEFDRAFQSAQQRIAALNKELREVPGQMTLASRGVELLKNQFAQLAAIYGGIQLAGKFVDANIQIESLRRGLTFITGSAAEASEQIEFLRTTANNAGVSVAGITQSFVTFNAAMRASGQSTETTTNLFKGLAGAAGTIGLSTERVNLVLTALGQIASKGKVNLEELQGQLGESLPGAVNIAAQSLGLTTAELLELTKTGSLLAEELLPALGRELIRTFGDGSKQATGFGAALNRLKNSLTELAQRAADTAPWKALTAATDFVAANLGAIASAAKGLIEVLLIFKGLSIAREFLGMGTAASVAAREKLLLGVAAEKAAVAVATETAAVAANTLAVAANTTAKVAAVGASGALAVAATKTAAGVSAIGSKVGSLVGVLGGAYGTALTIAIAFQDQLGEGIARLGARLTGTLGSIEKSDKALQALAAAEKKAAEESQKAADVQIVSSAKVVAQYTRMIEAAENNVATSKKYADAKLKEAEATEKLGTLLGDETIARDRNSAAAINTVNAQDALVQATTNEVTVREALRASLIATAGGYERLSAAAKKRVDDLDLELEKAKAANEVAGAALEARKNEATASFISAQAARDNSASLSELGDNLARVSRLATTDAASQRELAIAMGLYKDALADSIRGIGLKIRASESELGATSAVIRAASEESSARQRVAEVLGEETKSIGEVIERKRLEVAQIIATTAQKKSEAELTIKQLELQKREITGTDDLATAKRKEIDFRIAAEQAKIKETAATPALIRAIEQEIRALRTRQALDKQSSDLRVQTAQAENAVIQASIGVKQARLTVDAQIAVSNQSEIAATQANIAIKRLQIEVIEASAEAKIFEARESLALAEKEMIESAAVGQLTANKEAELNIRKLNAEAKFQEARASLEAVRGIEGEIQALGKLSIAAKSAGDAERARLQAGTDGGAGLLAGSNIAARNAALGPSAPSGISRTSAGQLAPPDNSGDYFFNTARRGEGPFGLGVWELKPEAAARRNAGGAQGAIERARMEFANTYPENPNFRTPAPPPPAPTPTPTPSGGSGAGSQQYVVNVTIGGRNYAIDAVLGKANVDQVIASLEAAYRAGGGS